MDEKLNDHQPEQLMDILLVLDKEKKTIQAVKGVDEKGELQTVPANKKHQADFLKFNKHGDFFSNFFSNFMKQLKEPYRFGFYKVPAKNAENAAIIFQENVEHPTLAGDKMMDECKVKTDEAPRQEQKQAKEQGKEQEPNRQQVTQQVETQKESPQPENKPVNEQKPQSEVKTEPKMATKAESPNQPPEPKMEKQASLENGYRYDPAKINWEALKNAGLSRETLEKSNALEPMLKGFKTSKMHAISLNLDGIAMKFDARLSFQEKPDGTVFLAVHGIRQTPNLEQSFFGHTFSEEDKANLQRTGNMGRVVELVNKNTGEIIPSIISIDKQTNELVALRAEKIRIPDEIKGVKLNEQQKHDLQQGKAVYVEGMIAKSGKPFSSSMQFNAEKRYVEFLFGEKSPKQANVNKQGQEFKDVPKSFRKQELPDEQRNALRGGGTIHVGGLLDKKGKPYQGYITWNQAEGKMDFMFPSKYKEALAQGTVQPAENFKTQVAVNSEGKTHEATKQSTEPLKPAQTQPTEKQAEKKAEKARREKA